MRHIPPHTFVCLGVSQPSAIVKAWLGHQSRGGIIQTFKHMTWLTRGILLHTVWWLIVGRNVIFILTGSFFSVVCTVLVCIGFSSNEFVVKKNVPSCCRTHMYWWKYAKLLQEQNRLTPLFKTIFLLDLADNREPMRYSTCNGCNAALSLLDCILIMHHPEAVHLRLNTQSSIVSKVGNDSTLKG